MKMTTLLDVPMSSFPAITHLAVALADVTHSCELAAE